MQRIQLQLFSGGADIDILFSIIRKGVSVHLYIRAVMDRLGPDKGSDSLLLQHPVGQWKVAVGVRCCSLNWNDISVDVFQMLQVRN